MFEVPGSDITRVVIEEDTARGYHPARYEHKLIYERDISDQVEQQDLFNHSSSETTDRSEIKTSVL